MKLPSRGHCGVVVVVVVVVGGVVGGVVPQGVPPDSLINLL